MHQEVKTHRKLLLMLSVAANVVSPDVVSPDVVSPNIVLPPRSIEFSQLSDYTPPQLLACGQAFNTDRRVHPNNKNAAIDNASRNYQTPRRANRLSFPFRFRLTRAANQSPRRSHRRYRPQTQHN